MTNKNLTEKSNPDAKYGYGDLTPDEIALLKSDGIDKIDKTGSNVFAVSKSVLKDITRRADQENQGKKVKAREKKMETAESIINRLRSQASSIMEVSTNPGDVPAPAASDNPQAGANEVQNDPKPGKSDSTSNIKLKLKNIAIAAADVHDGVSEDSEIEPWMEQCITRTESEMKKIVDHFRSKTDDDKNVTNESLEEAKYKKPLPGHIYHTKSNSQLQYIRKDASTAAKAMRGHNPEAEAKYLDQVNDASTILHHRAAFGLQQEPETANESVDEAKNYYQGANPFTFKTGADGKLVTVSKPKPLKGNAAIRASMAAYEKKNEEVELDEAEDDGWYAHREIHGANGISKEDWKKGYRMNLKGEKVLAKEEVELDEKLAADATAADYIHDFVHSKDPRFEGKTKAERTKMALGAFYSKNEEVEIDEEEIEEEVFHVVKSKTDSYGPAGHVSTHATSKRARSAADRRSEKNGGAAFHVVRVEEETSSLAKKILEARVKKSLEPKAKPMYPDHKGNATFVYPVKKTTSEDTSMPTNDGQHPDADPASTTIPNVSKKKKPTGSSPAASAMEEYFKYIGIHESRRNGSVLSTDENKE